MRVPASIRNELRADLALRAIREAQLLRPRRERCAEALDVVRGMPLPREAWEALVTRGMIPGEWLDDPRRGFQAPLSPQHMSTAKRPPRDAPLTVDHTKTAPAISRRPMSPRMAALLAADVPGIVTVEHLVREYVSRARPWSTDSHPCFAPERIVWRHADTYPDVQAYFRPAEAARSVAATLAPARGRIEPITERPPTFTFQRQLLEVGLYEDWQMSWNWRRAAATGAVVPETWGGPFDGTQSVATSLVGRPLSTLTDPFEPLVGIWALGYWLLRVAPDGVVVLLPDGDDKLHRGYLS
jgi:hypothetical protein